MYIISTNRDTDPTRDGETVSCQRFSVEKTPFFGCFGAFEVWTADDSTTEVAELSISSSDDVLQLL